MIGISSTEEYKIVREVYRSYTHRTSYSKSFQYYFKIYRHLLEVDWFFEDNSVLL